MDFETYQQYGHFLLDFYSKIVEDDLGILLILLKGNTPSDLGDHFTENALSAILLLYHSN